MSKSLSTPEDDYAAQIRRLQASLRQTLSVPAQHHSVASSPFLHTLETGTDRKDSAGSLAGCRPVSTAAVDDVAGGCPCVLGERDVNTVASAHTLRGDQARKAASVTPCSQQKPSVPAPSPPPLSSSRAAPSLSLFSRAVVSASPFDDLITRAWGGTVNSSLGDVSLTRRRDGASAASSSSSSSSLTVSSTSSSAGADSRSRLATDSAAEAQHSQHDAVSSAAAAVGGKPLPKHGHDGRRQHRATHPIRHAVFRGSAPLQPVLAASAACDSSEALNVSSPLLSGGAGGGKAARPALRVPVNRKSARTVTSACVDPLSQPVSQPARTASSAAAASAVSGTTGPAQQLQQQQQRFLLSQVQQLDRVLDCLKSSSQHAQATRLLRRLKSVENCTSSLFLSGGRVNVPAVRELRERLVGELLNKPSTHYRSARESPKARSTPSPSLHSESDLALSTQREVQRGVVTPRQSSRAESCGAHVTHSQRTPSSMTASLHAYQGSETVSGADGDGATWAESAASRPCVSNGDPTLEVATPHLSTTATVESAAVTRSVGSSQRTTVDDYAASVALFRRESEAMRQRQQQLMARRPHLS